MRGRRIVEGLSLLAVWGLVVFAPFGARADDAAQARFHDQEARSHYEAGRFEQALEEFFLAERLAPNPRTVFNIALCFDRLHREEEAYLFYQEYAASDDADETRRSFVLTALARLEPRLARVRVDSDPPGATVYVDGRDHGAYGTTPRVLALPAGSHRVQLEREGYVVAESEVLLARGQEATVSLSLTRVVGHLVVESSVGGSVTVQDDAGAIVASGPAPLDAILPAGAFSVELVAEGHRPWRDLARVEADASRTLIARPEPLPAPTGELTITSNIPGASIEVDGERVGFAPTVLPGVSVGQHRVEVHSEGLDAYEGSVSIEPNVRSWLTVSLVPPARTTRSELTWIVGGVGLAAAAAWGVLGALAISNRDAFDRGLMINNDPTMSTLHSDVNPLREQGNTLSAAADITLGVAAAAVGLSVVLFFATENTESAESSGATAREER